MSKGQNMTTTLFAEILRDTHRYTPGLAHGRPTLVARTGSPWKHRVGSAGDRARDALERMAGRLGFSHRHFDPELAAGKLARLTELIDGLEETFARLADAESRQTLVDLLTFRILGPFHARLALTAQEFRDRQALLDRGIRLEAGTFSVSDPWFSPLSLYRVPVGGTTVDLHAHSVDVVSVFQLGQYSYEHGPTVKVEPGDVVFDVGGCWGDTALYFAGLVGSEGRVYTFEFDPESLEILRTNLSLNPELADRIEVVERALWSRTGETLSFAPAGRCTAVQGATATDGGCQVRTVTVDDFVREAGLDRVDFIKVDVEGAELSVLAGASTTLSELAPKLAIAAYHKDDDLVQIPRALLSPDVGYDLYLGTFSPVEEETVLFAKAASRSNST